MLLHEKNLSHLTICAIYIDTLSAISSLLVSIRPKVRIHMTQSKRMSSLSFWMVDSSSSYQNGNSVYPLSALAASFEAPKWVMKVAKASGEIMPCSPSLCVHHSGWSLLNVLLTSSLVADAAVAPSLYLIKDPLFLQSFLRPCLTGTCATAYTLCLLLCAVIIRWRMHYVNNDHYIYMQILYCAKYHAPFSNFNVR